MLYITVTLGPRVPERWPFKALANHGKEKESVVNHTLSLKASAQKWPT